MQKLAKVNGSRVAEGLKVENFRILDFFSFLNITLSLTKITIFYTGLCFVNAIWVLIYDFRSIFRYISFLGLIA